jgi:hypothetical protein
MLKSLTLLAVALFCLSACSTSQHAQKPTQSEEQPRIGFPAYPPIADANPAVRHTVIFHYPTKLNVKRTADRLSVSVSPLGRKFAKITVGHKMVTGVQTELFVYRYGEPRPTNFARLGISGEGIDFNLGTDFLNANQEGMPLPEKKYVVEMDLAVFETDIPVQHMWHPQGEKFKILWKRTVKQIVE